MIKDDKPLRKNHTIEELCSLISPIGSFLKPCIFAIGIIINDYKIIPIINKVIDLIHINLKILDDFNDWEEDIQYKNMNILLSQAILWRNKDNINKSDILRFMVGSDIPLNMLAFSIQSIIEAKKILNNDEFKYLISYLDSLESNSKNRKRILTEYRDMAISSIISNLKNIE